MFNSGNNTEITTRQGKSMEEFCKFLQELLPANFVMKPSNSSAALLHWKALFLIVASLEEERKCGNAGGSANADSRVHPHAFDSHFHLDITL